MASPAPLTSPTRTAEAPSDASNGPVTERAPSYTMSAARLTTPNPTTVRHGDQDRPARARGDWWGDIAGGDRPTCRRFPHWSTTCVELARVAPEARSFGICR